MIDAWILSAMLVLSPPERAATAPAYPGWAESSEAREERYHAIASDLAEVVSDEEEPMLFSGADKRERTAAWMLAVAYHESGFARDVDIGPCYQGRGMRCDGGRAACMMQVQSSDPRERERLFSDRKHCFRAALQIMRRSFAVCRANTAETRLAAYGSGSCDKGLDPARDVAALAQRIWRIPR